MTAAFGKYGDPEEAGVLSRQMIERPRLITKLSKRFNHRLTVVVGGGGAGKSTLLGQAMAAELDGVDMVHSCTSADREQARLMENILAAALGSQATQHAKLSSVEAIVEQIIAKSPNQVCVILDDTHHLDDFAVVSELLEQLPRNGHVLLAGRRRPSIETARLDAAGQLLEITQDDLLMTEEERIDFANLRGIDIELLERTNGWPAFVELAATGSEIRSLRYLQEEALNNIAPSRRRALAAFAFVGGGDNEICQRLTGIGLAELVADLPLVRWDGDHAWLHDLWGEALLDDLNTDDRRQIAAEAAEVLRHNGEFDRAIDLGRQADDWTSVLASLGAAVRDGVDGGLRSDRLRRWRSMVPANHSADPVIALIDGLIEREIDPTSDATVTALQRGADGFGDAGNSELELVALLQLGYVTRIGGNPEQLGPIIERTEKLAESYPAAKPFLAFGEAWTALAAGRPDLQLAAMDRVAGQDLPPVWRITRDHLRANALFALGRPNEALQQVPQEIETLPVPIPGALVTESQCLWHAGYPERAMARKPSGMDSRYGARDRLIAGLWNALMYVTAGDMAEARRSLNVAMENHGQQPSVMVATQVFAVETLIKLAEGNEAEAAQDIDGVLVGLPLGEGVSEQLLRNFVATVYTLCPTTRSYWDNAELGPAIESLRVTAAAFVAAREQENDGLLRTMDWPAPGMIAAHLPAHWSVELGLRGAALGAEDGRQLIRWLCEHWGDPARTALRSWVDDEALGRAARDMLAQVPSPPAHHTAVRILGSTDVRINDLSANTADFRRERCRALLVLLVLRRSATRDELAGALWPDHSADRATKNLRTTLGYVHNLLEPRRVAGDAPWFIRLEGHQIRVNGELDVDLWRFVELLDQADIQERAGHPTAALPMLLDACQLWRGDLAADLDAEFLELDRIHLRSRYIRASCRAAELLVATNRPSEAIEVARRALDTDRWSERGYRTLADAYLSLGDRTAAAAVMTQAEQALGTV